MIGIAASIAFLLLCSFLRASGRLDEHLKSYIFDPRSARDLHKNGPWLIDFENRYVLLRGVNLGSRSKLPPYIPVMPLESKTLDQHEFICELQKVTPDFALLHSLGMNVVRLPIMWKALEPTPNPDLTKLLPEATEYLNYLETIINKLYYCDHLFVIVDFHQDIANEDYGGDGFPDWAMGVDYRHKRLSPASNLKDKTWGTNYLSLSWFDRLICHCFRGGSCGDNGSLVRNTLRSFWFNELLNTELSNTDRSVDMVENPQTHFVKTVGQVAHFFADFHNGAGHPAIIGYELFNEPHQAGLPKEYFEQNVLPKLYSQATAEIRKYDPVALIFIEPRVDWTTYSAIGSENQGLNFTLEPRTFLPSRSATPIAFGDVFAFHYYDPWMVTGFPFRQNMKDKIREWPGVFQQMHNAAVSRGFVPFLTEFGCSQDWSGHTGLDPEIYHHNVVRACMDLQFQQVEAQLLNETYWNYDLYNTQRGKDNWNRENFSLLGPNRSPRNLDIVARPYPMRSSGLPQRIFFDLKSKNAAFILGPAVTDSPTVIFVPRSLHYPGDDFEVYTTTSESSVVWDEDNQLLYWAIDKTRENRLVISPCGGFRSAALPSDLADALFKTNGMVVGRNKKTPVPLETCNSALTKGTSE